MERSGDVVLLHTIHPEKGHTLTFEIHKNGKPLMHMEMVEEEATKLAEAFLDARNKIWNPGVKPSHCPYCGDSR